MTHKKIKYALSMATLALGSGFLMPSVFADDIVVSDYEQLDAALCEGGNIVLGDDILADRWLASGCEYFVTKDTTIDFNGHTITSPSNRSYNFDFYDATLIFKDSVGGGGYIQEGDDTSAINITNGKFIMDGGIIDGSMWTVTLWHDAELEMNGGEIHASNGLAITGNGTTDPSKANYGSNTKITINDGVVSSANDYAIYNPAENSTIDIMGGSITGGSGAIAANRGVVTISGGELKSLGIAEVSGDVAQDGTRGYENAVIGIPKEYGPVTLNIAGGSFINEGSAELIADVSNLDNQNAAIVGITGGTFTSMPLDEYITDDHDIYLNGGLYVVDESAVAYQGGDLFLQKGDSKELDLGAIGNKYATLTLDGEKIIDIDDRTIVATTEGRSAIIINYNSQIHPMSTTIGVIVYSVGADDDGVIEGDGASEVADFTASQVKELLESGEESNNAVQLMPQFNPETGDIVKSGLDRLKDALANGDELFTYLDALDYAEEYWAQQEGMDCINEHLGENEEVAMVYGVNLGLFAGDLRNQLGEVTDLGQLIIDFDLEIPEDYREAPEGYTRDFSVLRFHRGVWDRIDADRDGELLKTSSSIFSTYVVSYTDVENETAPVDPGENIKPEENGDTSNETEGAETETESEAAVPQTGTVTMAGASASLAAIVTAVVVGVLTSVAVFAVLIRRR